MTDTLSFTKVEGIKKTPGIVVYGLSTCGFCKRAIAFLTENGFSFEYTFLDLIPVDQKNAVKQELCSKFGRDVAFPFVVIDDRTVLTGFTQSRFEETLLKEESR